ncbi:hypothetical protein BK816_01195 [Boudabousia tangfeifanii]|uniref:Small multi-drug export protein n=2 Tax=Boudabousia tangfeifanii TaxID=1912795 RepID=A0A1D9MM77_9ACTO|nr:hypothetical protein BK816_01195 [Boudabousia tangfeifanii]
MFESLHEFVHSLPVGLQWLGVMLIAAIPFVESYGATAIGIAVGVHPLLVIPAAILGNVFSMLVFVFLGKTAHNRLSNDRELSGRKARFKNLFDKYGVAVVSLIGQTVLPSQITSGLMVSFGAHRKKVINWQVISICIWAIAFGAIALGLLNVFGV